MKRRRISNQSMEEAVQKVLPFYKLKEAVRPDGEYADESIFTFIREGNQMAFPKKFTVSIISNEDDMYDITLGYENFETRKIFGENKLNTIKEIKAAIATYSGFLDINQTQEVIERYVRECFTPSYIEKHKSFFEGRVRDIVKDFHEGNEDEFGRIKAGTLYSRLEDEVLWLPVRHVENHFEYTFPAHNFAIDKRDKAMIGHVYKVKLPLREGRDFGGGTKRPCVIIGQSSRGFYYVAPLQHIRNEELRKEEYFVYNDEEGQPVYLVEGFIECVQEKDIYNFMNRVDKQTYERICALISKDNRIQTGVYDFMVGMGGVSSDDRFKAKVNAYDKNFKFPSETEIYQLIDKTFSVDEKIKKTKIYKRIGTQLDFNVEYKNDDMIFNVALLDGNTRIIKLSPSSPVDVLSNFKDVTQTTLTPDKVLTAYYRKYMIRKDSKFKYMLLKRLTSFFFGCYYRAHLKGDADALDKNIFYFQRQLAEANLVYDGDLAELIQFGIEKIELSKLRDIPPQNKTKNIKQEEEEAEVEL